MLNSEIQNIDFYLKCFKNLKRDRKNGGAPHKPILLLSIIQMFELGNIQSNRIFITPELVSSFKSNWNKLVINSKSNMTFALPYYHMQSEPFWRLIANTGCEKWVNAKSSMRSFSNLNVAVNYAEIDIGLYNLLKENNYQNILKQFLLNEYFPDSKLGYSLTSMDLGLECIRNNILEKDSYSYIKDIEKLEHTLNESSFEEEIFIRSSVFKREVPKIYDYKCCISGLRVDAIANITMIDACHIRPFSESYDDTITNGLALCPNLHRAFDRGLISIDENYRVLVSLIFTEPNICNYSIIQFQGTQIFLPDSEAMYPSQQNLNYHRNKFGFEKKLL